METFDKVLRDGDRITVTPKNIAGEFSPVKRKVLLSYIKSIGFKHYGGGKGDHDLWINASGQKLTINSLDGDKKYVDKACISALAKLLDCGFSEARNKIVDQGKN